MGSFYNVVGFRLSNNGSLINPKNSYCPNCKHKLSAIDLIPILSYLFLGGKCRYCKQKISAFYPFIEFITGVLFAVAFYSFGFSYELVIALLLVSYFAIVIVSDLNYYIIPDEVTLTMGILIMIVNGLNYGFVTSFKYMLFGLIMFLFMYVVGILGRLMFKQEALGGGDIKMLFVLGMTLPILLSFYGIILGTCLALPISIYLMIKHNDKVIPFGPFLVAGFLIIYLLKIDINDLYRLFSII